MNKGDLIAGYTIVRKIGSGSFGQVYLAKDGTQQQRVVIKVCSYRGNLVLEYELLKQWWNEQLRRPILWPPNNCTAKASMPRVYSAIDEPAEDRFSIVMQHGGPTVEHNLHQFTRNWKAVRALIGTLSKLLCTLHGIGYVHNDIKPANVLMQVDDDNCMHFTLIDFGCATPIHHKRNYTHSFLGTTRYASIRQMAMEWTTVGSDDIESLLYMAMFLYYGTLPWMNSLSEKGKRPASHAQTAPELRQLKIERHREVRRLKQYEATRFASTDPEAAELESLLTYLFLLPYDRPVDYKLFEGHAAPSTPR